MQRIPKLLDVLSRLAGGDHQARMPVSEQRDDVDAVIAAVNMLGETLEAEHAARCQAESLLEDELLGYLDSPGLLASIDLGLRLLICNETFASVVGQDREGLVGTLLTDFHPEEHASDLLDYIEHLLNGDGPDDLELDLLSTTDPLRRRVVLRGAPVRSADGQIQRIRLLYADVTEERTLQRNLRQAEKMEAVVRLAGSIAHDFNNLLTVIQMTVSNLVAEATDDDQRADLEDLDLATRRASSLMLQLLSLSRGQELRPELTDLNAAAEHLTRRLGPMIDERMAIDFVACPWTAPTWVVSSELEEVLFNLAVNARDAMVPEGGTLRIRTDTVDLDRPAQASALQLPLGRYSVIMLSDTGKGIPKELLDRVFEPFFSTKRKGRGLGLAIAFGVMRRAKGAIHCRSEEGTGTTFELYFPAAETKPTPPGAHPPPD